MMWLLDATAQEIVTMAQAAFVTKAGRSLAEAAANLGVFCPDGITGDKQGLRAAGVCIVWGSQPLYQFWGAQPIPHF